MNFNIAADRNLLLRTAIILFCFLFTISTVHAESKAAPNELFVINDENSQQLLDAFDNEEWLIFFHADWCMACRQFLPRFHDLAAWARTAKPNLKVVSINNGNGPIITSRFLIASLPTIVYVRDGRVRNLSSHRNRIIEVLEGEEWKSIKPTYSFLSPKSRIGNILATIAHLGTTVIKRANGFMRLSRSVQALILLGAMFAFFAVFFGMILLDRWLSGDFGAVSSMKKSKHD